MSFHKIVYGYIYYDLSTANYNISTFLLDYNECMAYRYMMKSMQHVIVFASSGTATGWFFVQIYTILHTCMKIGNYIMVSDVMWSQFRKVFFRQECSCNHFLFYLTYYVVDI